MTKSIYCVKSYFVIYNGKNSKTIFEQYIIDEERFKETINQVIIENSKEGSVTKLLKLSLSKYSGMKVANISGMSIHNSSVWKKWFDYIKNLEVVIQNQERINKRFNDKIRINSINCLLEKEEKKEARRLKYFR